ncbi:MAG: hypothetical protein ACHQLQ_10460 [Candidatus Acidiferrales bacterium]
MVERAQFQQILWAANVSVGVILAVLLIVRKNYRLYPAFSCYIFVNLIQALLLFLGSSRWGFSLTEQWLMGSLTESAVLIARALAVAEICRRLLSRYRGVWALAWRVLVLFAGVVFFYSILLARHDWRLAFPSAHRALELSIASIIVTLLVFARHYDVKTEPADRSLAIGFCLYSCFAVLNNTLLERWLYDYSAFWNLLGMFTFLASLSLWTWTLRKPQFQPEPGEILLPRGVYQSLTPEINLRLRLLNEQLSRFWPAEAKHS